MKIDNHSYYYLSPTLYNRESLHKDVLISWRSTGRAGTTPTSSPHNKKGLPNWKAFTLFGGGREIRTHGGLQTHAGFQDQCIQPLCQPSRKLLLFNIIRLEILVQLFSAAPVYSLYARFQCVDPLKTKRIGYQNIC